MGKISGEKHGEKCRECKETVKQILERIFGYVDREFRVYVGKLPQDFRGEPYYDA